jgi:DNA end-binding protein Ku
MAAIGRMTMSDKERVVLIHYYRGAIVATALRYPDEVRDLSHLPQLEDLPEPDKDELDLAMKIVDKLTVNLDLGVFHDSHREKAKKAGGQEHDGGAAGDGGIVEVTKEVSRKLIS